MSESLNQNTIDAPNSPIQPDLHRLMQQSAPPLPGTLSNLSTFAWRALLKIKHVPEQLFDVLITPIMFTVMFTFLFGGALAGSPQEYLVFLLPGILAQTVVFTTIYTGVTLNTDISKGIYDRFKSMPIWRASPLVGAMAGDVIRYTGSSVIVFAIGLLLGYRPEGGVFSVVLAIVLLNLFAFGSGWVFTTLGLLLRTPGAVMTLSWAVLMPVTFASNIFVDPATMPDWLQAAIGVNPVAHLVTALRDILAGQPSWSGIALSLLAPAVLTAIFGPLTMVLYQRQR
ncbi:ABC transporter [Saccharospirillum sp. MSK14-1]|uniref:ABC transporter permease n=1 Tax=Saccharospirillum sp. MSK14-1 TaxID=1897632 RepID=UPI000D4EED89|nr:ABC transporter permease [Saccharospirillum sp. MSK14-1]PTY38773.1 ABC transporter [Saccharospirillum sp. MSK14-1]